MPGHFFLKGHKIGDLIGNSYQLPDPVKPGQLFKQCHNQVIDWLIHDFPLESLKSSSHTKSVKARNPNLSQNITTNYYIINTEKENIFRF